MIDNLYIHVNKSQTAFIYINQGETPSMATTYTVKSPLSWLPNFEASTIEQAQDVANAIELLSNYKI